MKAQAIHQIEAEIAEMCNNLRELDEENKSLCGFWINTWNTITFRMGKSSEEIEKNGEKISETMQKIAEARERLAAIKGGDKDALTGGKTEKEKLEESVSKGREEQGASRTEAEEARKRDQRHPGAARRVQEAPRDRPLLREVEEAEGRREDRRPRRAARRGRRGG